jgi:hypothetical protein
MASRTAWWWLPTERTDRSPRSELVTGRSIAVTHAGQADKHGFLRSMPGDAVAALAAPGPGSSDGVPAASTPPGARSQPPSYPSRDAPSRPHPARLPASGASPISALPALRDTTPQHSDRIATLTSGSPACTLYQQALTDRGVCHWSSFLHCGIAVQRSGPDWWRLTLVNTSGTREGEHTYQTMTNLISFD